MLGVVPLLVPEHERAILVCHPPVVLRPSTDGHLRPNFDRMVAYSRHDRPSIPCVGHADAGPGIESHAVDSILNLQTPVAVQLHDRE